MLYAFVIDTDPLPVCMCDLSSKFVNLKFYPIGQMHVSHTQCVTLKISGICVYVVNSKAVAMFLQLEVCQTYKSL